MPAFRDTWFLSKNWLQSQDRWGGLAEPPPASGKAFRTSPLLGLRRLRNKAVFTRNAIEVYNQYLTHHFTKLKKKGKIEEIQTRAVTRIEIFGNNGEIFVYKARRARKDAVGAELVFEQLDLQLETIADDEE